MKGTKPEECLGRTYGQRTVIEYLGVRQGRTWVKVRCTCGTVNQIQLASLRYGKRQSCGCLRITRIRERSKQGKCAPGETFGRLTVIKDMGIQQGNRRTHVQCICGASLIVRQADLRRGKINSCGCLRVDHVRAKTRTHGESHKTAEYRTWKAIRRRCQNPNNADADHYFARGIRVCARWNHYQNFLADMGRRPTSRHSIERLNNNKDYTPTNCVWATSTQQVRNRRKTVYVTYRGVTHPLAHWADLLGISYGTLLSRRHRGETPANILRAVGAPRIKENADG